MSLDNKIEEQEVVRSNEEGEYEHREKVIEDVGARRRQAIDRVIQLTWLMFGGLEGLLGLRFLLKLIGANPSSPFSALVYDFSDLFLWPFAGLTASPQVGRLVLEIPVMIAMIVFALLGWMLTKLIWIVFAQSSARKVEVFERWRDQ